MTSSQTMEKINESVIIFYLVIIPKKWVDWGVKKKYDRHFFTHELLTSCHRPINAFIWPCTMYVPLRY